MGTLIIGNGAIHNAPIVVERVLEPLSSRPEGPSPVNVCLARELEAHERGNLFWWKQEPYHDPTLEAAKVWRRRRSDCGRTHKRQEERNV